MRLSLQIVSPQIVSHLSHANAAVSLITFKFLRHENNEYIFNFYPSALRAEGVFFLITLICLCLLKR